MKKGYLVTLTFILASILIIYLLDGYMNGTKNVVGGSTSAIVNKSPSEKCPLKPKCRPKPEPEPPCYPKPKPKPRCKPKPKCPLDEPKKPKCPKVVRWRPKKECLPKIKNKNCPCYCTTRASQSQSKGCSLGTVLSNLTGNPVHSPKWSTEHHEPWYRRYLFTS